MAAAALEQVETFRQYGGSTPEYTLAGLKTWGRVVSIYDADTMKVVIPFQGAYFKYNVRLSGIDTCEMKAKGARNKEYAVRARDRVFEIITGRKVDASWKKKDIERVLDTDVYLVWVVCDELDKYGRVMGDVWVAKEGAKSISTVLLEERLAYPYQGETKLTEEEQVAFLES